MNSTILSGPPRSPRYPGGIWKRRFHFESASNVFSPHHAGGNNSATITRHFRFGFKPEKLSQEIDSHDDRDAIISEKRRFQNVFSPGKERGFLSRTEGDAMTKNKRKALGTKIVCDHQNLVSRVATKEMLRCSAIVLGEVQNKTVEKSVNRQSTILLFLLI